MSQAGNRDHRTPACTFLGARFFDRIALWCGFDSRQLIRRSTSASDSAYGDLFKSIRQRSGRIDLALLPIGAYEPRWFMKSVHMNPEEAAQAHVDLEPSRSVAMHYGTFQLTTEGIDEPLRALAAARQARGIQEAQFQALGFGESLRVG